MRTRFGVVRGRTRFLAGLVAISALAALVAIPAGPALAKRIAGTNGADTIVGTKKADRINARGGNDRVNGRGRDRLKGAKGKDRLKGVQRQGSACRWQGRRPAQWVRRQGPHQGRQGQGSDFGLNKGADRLIAVDGRKDRAVNGGPGKDVCTIDQADLPVLKYCETAKVKNGPAARAAVPAPVLATTTCG